MPPWLVGAAVGVPAGLFACVLIERVPDKLPLLRPLPRLKPWPHLAVVAATVVLFALAGVAYEGEPAGELLVVLVLFAALVPLSVIDIVHLRLPDRIVAPSYAILLTAIVGFSLAWREPERIRYAVLGGLIWVVVLGLGWLVGMGFGDVKAGGVMGMVLGWLGATSIEAGVAVVWALAIGTLLASAYGIVTKVVQVLRVPPGERGRAWFAFGPFLAFGCVVVVLLGDQLIAG